MCCTNKTQRGTLCKPKGHNRLNTGSPMQHDCITLFNAFYNISLTTGKFAAKSNGEDKEELCVKIDYTVDNCVDFMTTRINITKIVRMGHHSLSF